MNTTTAPSLARRALISQGTRQVRAFTPPASVPHQQCVNQQLIGTVVVGLYQRGEILPSGRFWVQHEAYQAVALHGLLGKKRIGDAPPLPYRLCATAQAAAEQFRTIAGYRAGITDRNADAQLAYFFAEV